MGQHRFTPLAVGAVLLWASAGGALSAPICPATTAFAFGLDHLDGYRVFTGADGDSDLEPLHLSAREVPLLKTGKILGLLQLPTSAPRGAQIVIGPPDVDLPLHKAPYKEMFILLGGSFTFKTQKVSVDLRPGSVLLFEDTDAKLGHGAHIGPCGYVSISLAP